MECPDKSLRAFLNLNMNCELVLGAAIVVVDFGLNLGLAKSVGDIEGLQAGNIALEQELRCSVREKTCRRVESAGGAEHLLGEIFVACDLDEFELVYRTRIDVINHAQAAGAGFLLHLDGGVEVAAALQVIEEVALAFVQQVVIQRVLLVDRNFFFQTPRPM